MDDVGADDKPASKLTTGSPTQSPAKDEALGDRLLRNLFRIRPLPIVQEAPGAGDEPRELFTDMDSVEPDDTTCRGFRQEPGPTELNPSYLPPWVVLHVPHDSEEIPAEIAEQFLLDGPGLERELRLMTDELTAYIFGAWLNECAVIAPVSRLVVDVDRFEDDSQEPMAACGMGAIYTHTSHLEPLRRPLGPSEREHLLAAYYRPHHERLEAAVASSLGQHGRCVILDCHSFPGTALPYEQADLAADRPDICIGTDSFHTDDELRDVFVRAFQREGWKVALDTPFSGAMVPASRYRTDARVQAVMVEINRTLYLDPETQLRKPGIIEFGEQVRRACKAAVRGWELRQDRDLRLM